MAAHPPAPACGWECLLSLVPLETPTVQGGPLHLLFQSRRWALLLEVRCQHWWRLLQPQVVHGNMHLCGFWGMEERELERLFWRALPHNP